MPGVLDVLNGSHVLLVAVVVAVWAYDAARGGER